MRDGLLAGCAALLSAAVWQRQSGNTDLVALFLLLTAWLAYLMFFINLLNSVTLKMLEHLARADGGKMQKEDFAVVFSEDSGLQARLSDMRANGFIAETKGGFALTGKANVFLSAVSLTRKFIGSD